MLRFQPNLHRDPKKPRFSVFWPKIGLTQHWRNVDLPKMHEIKKKLEKAGSNVNRRGNKILYPHHDWNLHINLDHQKKTHFSVFPDDVRNAAES